MLHIFFHPTGREEKGFDNQGRQPRLNYDAAEFIIDSLYHDLPAWNKIVPDKFGGNSALPTRLKVFINWIRSLLSHRPVLSNDPVIPKPVK